jgi:hypothetical protein
MRPREIFEMKVVDTLPKNLSLMISLKAEAQPSVQSS